MAGHLQPGPLLMQGGSTSVSCMSPQGQSAYQVTSALNILRLVACLHWNPGVPCFSIPCSMLARLCSFCASSQSCLVQAAGAAFSVLFKGGAGSAVDSIIPSLLAGLEGSEKQSHQALEGLRVILGVRPQSFGSMVPRLLKPPLTRNGLRALASLAEVAGVRMNGGGAGLCMCGAEEVYAQACKCAVCVCICPHVHRCKCQMICTFVYFCPCLGYS